LNKFEQRFLLEKGKHGETIENPVRFYLIDYPHVIQESWTQRWMVNCDVTSWGHFYKDTFSEYFADLSPSPIENYLIERSHKADLGTACSLSDSGLWRFTRGCGGFAMLTAMLTLCRCNPYIPLL